MDTPLDYALQYAAMGWHVFPVNSVREIKGKLWCTCNDPNCNHQGKHPIGSLAPQGCKDATTDQGVIRQWWDTAPFANIGIATGKRSNLFVVDVDINDEKGKAGDETLKALEAEHGELPETAIAITGSGGLHYYFRYPDGVEKLKSSAGSLGKDIDTRGEGGYVVGVPGRNINGQYQYEGAFDPTDGMELAVVPDWIVEKLKNSTIVTQEADQGEVALSDVEVRELRSALGYINPDDRDVWVTVGMALHSTKAGNQGFGIWCEWSQGSEKFNAADQRRVWNSFKGGQGLTRSTIFDMAQRAGWLNTAAKQVVNGRATVTDIDRARRKRREVKEEWQRGLTTNKNGCYHGSIANVALILANDAAWQDIIKWDEFSLKVVKAKAPPFKVASLGEWTDRDDSKLSIWLSDHYSFRPSSSTIFEAVAVVAEQNPFHPVRSYLRQLHWDNVPRAATWMIRYLGAKDTPYARAISRAWLVSAVARVMSPGCKMDSVLILEGAQGVGKSQALAALGGEWFTDTPFELGSKDGFMAMRGHWLIELAELDSFNRAESTRAKQFFAARTDTYREPYAKRTQDVPRQCVFAGTTNADEYLRDETGNRRYWPIKTSRIDVAGLMKARDQLWAEAMALYLDDEPWWLDANIHFVKQEQEQRFAVDAWEPVISDWVQGELHNHLGHGRQRSDFYVTHNMIFSECLEMPIGKTTRADQMRVTGIFKRLGMIRRYVTTHQDGKSKRLWGYSFKLSE